MAIKTHFLSGTVISGKDAKAAIERLQDKAPNRAAKQAEARGKRLAQEFSVQGIVRVTAEPRCKTSAK